MAIEKKKSVSCLTVIFVLFILFCIGSLSSNKKAEPEKATTAEVKDTSEENFYLNAIAEATNADELQKAFNNMVGTYGRRRVPLSGTEAQMDAANEMMIHVYQFLEHRVFNPMTSDLDAEYQYIDTKPDATDYRRKAARKALDDGLARIAEVVE